MTQLTLTIDDAAADKARLLARQRQVTLERLVQELIENLDLKTPSVTQQAMDALSDSFRRVSTPLGGKPWMVRDELYDR